MARNDSFALQKWELPGPPDKADTSSTWRIGLLSDQDDYHCVLLASMGMTYDLIHKQTGLSHGQIAYRLKRAQVKAKDYRSGKSNAAKAVIQMAAHKIAKVVNTDLRQVIEV